MFDEYNDILTVPELAEAHSSFCDFFLSHISLTYRMLVWYTGLLYCSHASFLPDQNFFPMKSKSICPDSLLRDSSCYKLRSILFFFNLMKRALHGIFQTVFFS